MGTYSVVWFDGHKWDQSVHTRKFTALRLALGLRRFEISVWVHDTDGGVITVR